MTVGHRPLSLMHEVTIVAYQGLPGKKTVLQKVTVKKWLYCWGKTLCLFLDNVMKSMFEALLFNGWCFTACLLVKEHPLQNITGTPASSLLVLKLMMSWFWLLGPCFFMQVQTWHHIQPQCNYCWMPVSFFSVFLVIQRLQMNLVAEANGVLHLSYIYTDFEVQCWIFFTPTFL